MKTWNQRNRELLCNAIERNGSSYEVYINGIRVQAKTEGLEALELVLDDFDPATDELAVKVFNGTSNRNNVHTYGAQSKSGESNDVFELRLKVQRLEDRLERERERHEDKLDRVTEKLALCEKALENRNHTIQTLQSKEKNWMNQLGNVKDIIGMVNGAPAPPTAPQVGAAVPEKDEWADSLSGLQDLSSEEKEGVKDLLCAIALDPETISTINDLIT